MESSTAILCKIDDLNISDCNGQYQNMIANMVLKSGKLIDDLTVGELRHLIYEANRIFNE